MVEVVQQDGLGKVFRRLRLLPYGYLVLDSHQIIRLFSNYVSIAHSAAASEALSPAEPIGNQMSDAQLGTMSYNCLRINYHFLHVLCTFLCTS